MSLYISNAAPMVLHLGTEDLSTRTIDREQEQVPQHCPKYYLYTRKGPTTPQLCAGKERTRMYGSESFDLTSKYANHATVFANLTDNENNYCVYQRLIPDDAGPEANMTLWLDVLETTLDDYERNDDGSIKLSELGVPEIGGTCPGYKCKWVITNQSTLDGLYNTFSKNTIAPGDQVDEVTGTTSQRYPIMDFKISSKGEWGNLKGISIWPMIASYNSSLPTRMMTEERAFPFRLAVMSKPSEFQSATVEKTVLGETSIIFTLKPDCINPDTTGQMYLGDIFVNSYKDETAPFPTIFGSFGELIIYDNNVKTLLKKFITKEVPFVGEWTDFSDDIEKDFYLFNFFTGESTQGVPYHSFQLVDDVNNFTWSQNTTALAGGGSDGTMNDTLFAELVERELERYLDPDDELMETAVNVESIFYDSGFPLETKYKIPYFISNRFDTCVVLGTYSVGGREFSNPEEYSVGIALRTRLQNFPESEYFGTSTMRGVIVGFSGLLKDSIWKGRLPLTAELNVKASRYMGALDGRWKNGFNFDGAPGSIVESMYDISSTWVPVNMRNKFWSVGVNWVQAYGRRSFFFPAIKTVYPDDTSVLNSFITVMAICQLNKIADAAWREFSGVANLTNSQLIERVNAFVKERVAGIFDERFVIQPDCQITDSDALYGYRWTLPIKIYAPNMKTVQTTYIQAYRLEDLS